MKTLTNAINDTMDVPRITKWEVSDAHNYHKTTDSKGNVIVPHLHLEITAYGAGVGNVYGVYYLEIYDNQANPVLGVNAAPQAYGQALAITQASLAGTPYTTLAEVFNGNCTGDGTKAKRLKNVENVLGPAGVVSSALAGT
jgi:hypothetical protein